MEMWQIWWRPSLWAFIRSTSTSTAPAGGRMMTGRPWTVQRLWLDRPLRMASAWWACAHMHAQWETEIRTAKHMLHRLAGMHMLRGKHTHTCTHKCDVCFKLGVYTPEANLVSSTSRPDSSSVVLAYIHLHIHRWFCRKKACLWCCRWVEWKGENSGVKSFTGCVQNTQIYAVTACAATGFLPYRKWGALKEKASHLTKK